MNNEFETNWKEAIEASFKVLSQDLYRRIEENTTFEQSRLRHPVTEMPLCILHYYVTFEVLTVFIACWNVKPPSLTEIYQRS
jgi:hypothetical protein